MNIYYYYCKIYFFASKFIAFYLITVLQIKQQAEIYFINTDVLIEYDYALPVNVIPVGGLHIDSARPLFSVNKFHTSSLLFYIFERK